MEGQIDYLIEGLPLISAHQGDVVYVPKGRYHRATAGGQGMADPARHQRIPERFAQLIGPRSRTAPPPTELGAPKSIPVILVQGDADTLVHQMN